MAVGRSGFITALDIGSTKISCFIARRESSDMVRVIGIGHQAAKGIRNGTIVDMDAAEECIRGAVHNAERMAGETPVEVIVGFSGGRPRSHSVHVEVDIAGHAVGEMDLRRVLAAARSQRDPRGGDVLHSMPTFYSIDGERGVANPTGMYGDRLGVTMNFVGVDAGPLRNIQTLIERCHLETGEIVVSPYASGLSALVEDEMDLGVTLIEMGGGTTSVSVFIGGDLAFLDVLPIGGMHVTNDIAMGLSTPTRHAERMKTLYGSAIPGPAEEREMLHVPQLGDHGEENSQEVPRGLLTAIIQPRVEETLEMVRASLAASGLEREAGRRAVLTGGAAQLTGMCEMATQILGKQVRIGKPIGIYGLAEATEGPAFATCAGLLNYGVRGRSRIHRPDLTQAEAGGRMARIGKWFRENF